MRWAWWRKAAQSGEAKSADFEQVLRRMHALFETKSGVTVSAENCEKAPTVKAIVTAVSNRIATLPVHVYKKTTSNGRTVREKLPDHPIAKLLNRPNGWQTPVEYWLDATSRLVRFGNFYAYKGQGSTGPIRELAPLHPQEVTVEQDENWNLRYRWKGMQDVPFKKMHHARTRSRCGYRGDCPVEDVREAIALEMAAEEFGAAFFANGAFPAIVLSYIQGVKGFKDKEAEVAFMEGFQNAFTSGKRFRGLLLPPGMNEPKTIPVENDKAQFIETRKYQRTVIAGAFGVPPHLVGDLERGTWNNVEQQSLDFVQNVVLPYCRMFEAAMERDLLTDDDRRQGIGIRFNIDAALRADFKSRQEGLKIQREWGIISANEWREHEGMNPIDEDDGGDEYLRPMNMAVPGEEPPEVPPAPPPQDEEEAMPKSIHFHVEAPNVHNHIPAPVVHNHVPTPEIKNEVNVPQTEVHNHVETPKVQLSLPEMRPQINLPEQKAPTVINEMKPIVQPVTVKAPDVTIVNDLPEYEEVENEAVRDEAGRIVKTVTKKKRASKKKIAKK